jgi:hypothetical protein
VVVVQVPAQRLDLIWGGEKKQKKNCWWIVGLGEQSVISDHTFQAFFCQCPCAKLKLVLHVLRELFKMYRRLEARRSDYSIARNISCLTDEPDLMTKLECLCSENSCCRTVQEWIRYLICRQETTWTHQDSSATVMVSFSRQDLQGPQITYR